MQQEPRVATLEEVMEHYNNGIHFADNLDSNLSEESLDLNEEQISDLIAFMKTFTDQEFISDPKFQSPF